LAAGGVVAGVCPGVESGGICLGASGWRSDGELCSADVGGGVASPSLRRPANLPSPASAPKLLEKEQSLFLIYLSTYYARFNKSGLGESSLQEFRQRNGSLDDGSIIING